MSNTPETDHLETELGQTALQAHPVIWEHSRKLERERDEAREALSDWENAAAHVEADHPDEVHCGCVPVLRKLLTDARKERDDAQKESEYYRERYEQLKDEQEGEK